MVGVVGVDVVVVDLADVAEIRRYAHAHGNRLLHGPVLPRATNCLRIAAR